MAQDHRSTLTSNSPTMQCALNALERVAPTPATVLLLGETGVGKELFAEAIHHLSPRHQRPMVRINCGAIPCELIESELFGRERGAFTGAHARGLGRFEAAHRSSLFLDEIGELPPDLQVKLLRVLETRTFERLGTPEPITVDIRIIAASNRNLEEAVAASTFRADLLYRLNVFPIVVPPLRERAEDIPRLASMFVEEFSRSFGKPAETISAASMRELLTYPWPGNVRELRSVIERAVILSSERQLNISLPAPLMPRSDLASTLADRICEHIRTVLEDTNWRVRGPGGAAQLLGLHPATLESRMARLGIRRPAAL